MAFSYLSCVIHRCQLSWHIALCLSAENSPRTATNNNHFYVMKHSLQMIAWTINPFCVHRAAYDSITVCVCVCVSVSRGPGGDVSAAQTLFPGSSAGFHTRLTSSYEDKATILPDLLGTGHQPPQHNKTHKQGWRSHTNAHTQRTLSGELLRLHQLLCN